MSFVDSVLVVVVTFILVTLAVTIILRSSFGKAFADQRRFREESQEHIEKISARSEQSRERLEANRERVAELQGRQEKIQERWETILSRLEALVERLEKNR
jgi:TolA-binding protein